jgi:hypothetical protein
MFYGISNDQDYWKERLNLYVALAPVTRLNNCGSQLFVWASSIYKALLATLNLVKVWSILGGPASVGTKVACGLFPPLCQFAEGFLITSDPSLDDPQRFQVYMGHFPAGASVQSVIHYAQMMKLR